MGGNKSVSTVVPTAFAQFMFLSHFGNPCNLSNFFFIIIFVSSDL